MAANIHTHAHAVTLVWGEPDAHAVTLVWGKPDAHAVTLVWGSLRLAPIRPNKYEEIGNSRDVIVDSFM